MTLLRCPNTATIQGLRADNSTIAMCDPCADANMPNDVIIVLPLLQGFQPDEPITCELEG